MSNQYDQYLTRHRGNVKRAFDWIAENLPEILSDELTDESRQELAWAVEFAHDHSKDEPDEYEPYDAYFYGNNRSYEVVQNYQQAWLLHLHRNPHHWQYWVLINDDPKEGEIVLEMPYRYILEMICDWWSFSWQTGNLEEIFKWYDEHSLYMKLAPKTRATVESVLGKIRNKLQNDISDDRELFHHGVKGQKWGVKNGPPYPLREKSDNIVEEAIRSGEVSKTINKDKQKRHTKSDHLPGRSYLNGDLDYAQNLVDGYAGKGEAICSGKDKQWTHRERITSTDDIGVYVDSDGNETKSNNAMIVYSKTGTHVYLIRKERAK